MLSNHFLIFVSFVVWLLVDVEVGSFGVPVGVAHFVFFFKVFLRSPCVTLCVGVLFWGEWSFVFWDVHLIFSHQVVDSTILLIFEPSVRHTKIIVWMNTHWQLSWNWIPWVLMHFPNWCITEDHTGHLIVSTCWPQYLSLFSFGISNDLSTYISLVGLIENIDSEVHNKVSEINLFLWG